MNKKKLALEVLSSPDMKKIASMNLVDKKTLHKFIAEEVTEAAKRGDFYVGKEGSKGYNARKGIQPKRR